MNTFDEDELILDYAGAAYGYIIFIDDRVTKNNYSPDGHNNRLRDQSDPLS